MFTSLCPESVFTWIALKNKECVNGIYIAPKYWMTTANIWAIRANMRRRFLCRLIYLLETIILGLVAFCERKYANIDDFVDISFFLTLAISLSPYHWIYLTIYLPLSCTLSHSHFLRPILLLLSYFPFPFLSPLRSTSISAFFFNRFIFGVLYAWHKEINHRNTHSPPPRSPSLSTTHTFLWVCMITHTAFTSILHAFHFVFFVIYRVFVEKQIWFNPFSLNSNAIFVCFLFSEFIRRNQMIQCKSKSINQQHSIKRI